MDDTEAATIDELAAQLRDDPVIVQQVMGGGDAAKADTQITAIVDDLPFNTYVVLTQEMPGVTGEGDIMQDLITQLRTRVDDGPALWLAGTPQSASLGCEYVGMEPPVDDPYRACSPGSDSDLTAVGEVQMILSNVEGTDLDRGQIASEWAQPDLLAEGVWAQTPNAFAPLFVASLVAVVTFTIALRYSYLTFRRLTHPPVKAKRAVRQTEQTRPPQPDAASPPRPSPASTRPVGLVEYRERFEEAYDEAVDAGAAPEPLALARDLAERDEEIAVIAARVIARQAHAKAVDLPYRACFFHPDHSGPFEWRTIAAGARVRTCRACRTAVDEDDRVPDPLELHDGESLVPYYETDTVWARTGLGSLDDDLWLQVQAERDQGDLR